jgi:hypothetical protein
MFNDPYVIEKLIELEKRRAPRFSTQDLPPRRRHSNGIALAVGRAMRRAGEQLEAWAGPGGSQPRSDYSPQTRRY